MGIPILTQRGHVAPLSYTRCLTWRYRVQVSQLGISDAANAFWALGCPRGSCELEGTRNG